MAPGGSRLGFSGVVELVERFQAEGAQNLAYVLAVSLAALGRGTRGSGQNKWLNWPSEAPRSWLLGKRRTTASPSSFRGGRERGWIAVQMSHSS